MHRFFYKAFDLTGLLTIGEIDANSREEALRRLAEQGLRVETLTLPDHPPTEAARSPSTPTSDAAGRDKGEVKLSPKELEAVGERIAELAGAQLPLAPGLAALAEEMPDRRLKRGLRAISRKLEQGYSLNEVLDAFGAPRELNAVVRAGARTGRTSELLAGYVAHQRNRAAARTLVGLTLGYPLLLFMFAGGIIAFFLMYLVPSFKEIYEDFGTELPSFTLLLITLSNFLTSIGWKLFVGALLIAIIAAIVVRLFGGRGAWQSMTRLIPVVGSVYHWAGMARFCHLLAVMIDNRVPLAEALQLAADGTRNSEIRAACREMIAQVSGGAQPEPNPQFVSGFPAAMIRTLAEQKQTDALPATLHAVADMFENRARLQGGLVLAVFGPLLISLTGVFLASTVIAMFMPLVKLLNELS